MKEKNKKLAIGAIIAGVAGYIAGILTAPQSGKETRKDIKEGAEKAKLEAEKRLKHLHSELDVLIDKAVKETAKLEGKSKEGLEKAVKVALVAKEKAREILSLAHDGTTENKDLEKAVKDVSKAIDDLKTYLTKTEVEK